MKISTIIPVYNDGKHVERAVESALKQPEVFEVVLVEDGSTDNSLEICRMLSRKHEKVVLCTHPENKTD
jgi:glycosyltransferase involved in cell wall biosynthesis